MPSYRVEHPGSQMPYTDRFVLDTDDAAVADRVGVEMPGSVMTEDTVQGPTRYKKVGDEWVEDKDWITLEGGTHVFLDGDRVTAGPSRMVGHKPSEVAFPSKPKPSKPSTPKTGPITEHAEPKLSDDEEYALSHYTASAWINDELRGQELRPESAMFSDERKDEVRRELVSAFKKIRPMPHHTQVYRGLYFNGGEAE